MGDVVTNASVSELQTILMANAFGAEDVLGCPVLHLSYPLVGTLQLLDCRGLDADPWHDQCMDYLVHAIAGGYAGVVVPFTRMSEQKADVIHSGDSGWYIKSRDVTGTYYLAPSSEPCFRVAACHQVIHFPTITETAGFAVFMNCDDRRTIALSPMETSLLRYEEGSVKPIASATNLITE